MNLNEKHPFTKGTVNRIGESLKEGELPNVDDYEMVMDWFDELCNQVLQLAVVEVEQYAQIPGTPLPFQIRMPVEPSARVKTDDTIADKLIRLKTELSRVQDLAGCRIDMDCGLDALNEASRRLAQYFEKLGAKVATKNYLKEPQQGYRAIHLHLTFPAGRVELQLRTLAQARWANLNEVIGDKFGRQHRYGELTNESNPLYLELVGHAQEVSKSIQSIEEKKTRVLRKAEKSQGTKLARWLRKKVIAQKLREIDRELVVLLEGMAHNVQTLEWR